MDLVCRSCGVVGMSPTGSRGKSIVVRCSGCSERFLVGCDILEDGVMYVTEDLPQDLAAIGHSEDDPWVSFQVRLTVSQREIVHRALRKVKGVSGMPEESSLSCSRALELICGDFLAGKGVGDG